MARRKKTPQTEIKRLLDKTQVDEKVLAKVQELLDKTEVDDKVVGAVKDAKAAYADAKESGLIDKIKCYVKCYGGYVLAVGAGCLFGVNFWWGLGFLAAAGLWANKVTACPLK